MAFKIFEIGAGFAASRTTSIASATPPVARAHSGPRMQHMATRQGYDCLLSRMSSGIYENASQCHRFDLERLGRRANAECQFQDTLTDMKERIAWKTAVRTRSACADSIVELSYKAS